MYDPKWPHGHTFEGIPCRVLSDDIKDNHGYTIAIAFMGDDDVFDIVRVVRPDMLNPVPEPKRRIQGWITVIGRPHHVVYGIYPTKDSAQNALKACGSAPGAILHIDVDEEEGTGLQSDRPAILVTGRTGSTGY